MRLNISKVQLKDLFTQAQKPWQLEGARENCVFPNQLLTGEIGRKKGCCSGHLSANALTSSRLLQLPVFCMKYTDLSGNDYYTLSCSEIWKCLKLETDDNNLQSWTLLLQKKGVSRGATFTLNAKGLHLKFALLFSQFRRQASIFRANYRFLVPNQKLLCGKFYTRNS